MAENPYTVLGISPDADETEIKKKYRALVKEYHPDLHPGDEEAARKMSEINAAYEAIKSGNVNDYDTSSASAGNSGPGGSFSRNGTTYYYQYADAEDVLKAFFGGFGFNFNQGRGMDLSQAYERIDSYIVYGEYENAAAILNRIGSHDAKWYYYASRISEGMYNYSDAVKYADEAAYRSSGEYGDYARSMHKSYDKAIRRRKIIPAIISTLTLLMVISFIGRIFMSLFFWWL